MPRILHLETTAGICGVALSEGDGQAVLVREHEEPNAHSRVLVPMIEAALQEAGWSVNDLDAVAVSAGPGSYTGLRIGGSAAKGICFATGLPLIAVSTLEALVGGMRLSKPTAAFYIPLLDARRMEVYTAVYDRQGACLLADHPLVVDHNPFLPWLDQGSTVFFGSGAEKCRELLAHKNAFFEISAPSRVKDMLPLAHKSFNIKSFEDIASFEPSYLKAFWTTAVAKP